MPIQSTLKHTLIFGLLGALFWSNLTAASTSIAFGDLNLSAARSAVNKPAVDKDLNGKSMNVAGVKFEKGVTIHPPHNIRILLNGKTNRFEAI
ncbi:MAG: NPCBM/NEW2 domain-containing protein, partial [Planctomycetes bacterium]|nr:NPCBM/NEW2 domain-containing protein [Planctomycetota bacterium]